MKKVLSISAYMLIMAMLISSCQKSMTGSSEIESGIGAGGSLKSSCQLTYAVDWNGNVNRYYYNDKGLLSEWEIYFGGSAMPDVLTLHYDNDNRLIDAEWNFDGSPVGEIEFSWTGKDITDEHWNLGGFEFDVANTFDTKSQLIEREASYGDRGEMKFSPEGNNIENYVYVGDDPYSSDLLTFNSPVKNPFLAIPGLPYAFLYVNVVFSKWHETSDVFTYYDNGNPFVVMDTDPAQTVMQSGFQNYLSSVTFFDNVSSSLMTRDFEYQHCGPAASFPTRTAGTSSQNAVATKRTNQRMTMLLGPAENPVRKRVEKIMAENIRQ